MHPRFCAILLGESDAADIADKIAHADLRLTSHLEIMETALALGRQKSRAFEAGCQLVTRMVEAAGIQIVDITAAERIIALEAAGRFGKGHHPAKLNMGDCFAYACARTHGAPLLFKGDDFSKTDIEAA